MKFSRWQEHSFTKASITHHPQGLIAFAAIGKPPPAGIALLAIDIRLYRASISHLQLSYPFTCFKNLHAEFMAWNSRVTKKRHLPEKTTNIGPANTHTVNSNKNFSWPRLGR